MSPLYLPYFLKEIGNRNTLILHMTIGKGNSRFSRGQRLLGIW